MVPLWTDSPDGEWIEGEFTVPVRLAFTQEHTNERHQFNNLVTEKLGNWVEYRKQRGWVLNSEPKVTGPFDPPSNDKAKEFTARAQKVIGTQGSVQAITEFAHAEEVKTFKVFALFKRETPIYTKLEDVLARRDMTALYARDLPETDSGWVNPLQHAEARRKRLGLKREDYLMGPLNQPL